MTVTVKTGNMKIYDRTWEQQKMVQDSGAICHGNACRLDQ